MSNQNRIMTMVKVKALVECQKSKPFNQRAVNSIPLNLIEAVIELLEQKMQRPIAIAAAPHAITTTNLQ